MRCCGNCTSSCLARPILHDCFYSLCSFMNAFVLNAIVHSIWMNFSTPEFRQSKKSYNRMSWAHNHSFMLSLIFCGRLEERSAEKWAAANVFSCFDVWIESAEFVRTHLLHLVNRRLCLFIKLHIKWMIFVKISESKSNRFRCWKREFLSNWIMRQWIKSIQFKSNCQFIFATLSQYIFFE